MDADLASLFESSLTLFVEEERDLIWSGVSERCLCSRFAMILEPMARGAGLSDYRADVEYNRHGVNRKGYVRRQYHDFVPITCDIVLHARGMRDPDNLIAIEMKRASHRLHDKERDRERLLALTSPEQRFFDDDGREIVHVSGYRVGYLLELLDGGQFRVEEYAGGERVREWTFPA